MEQLSKPQIICHIEKSVDFSLFDAKWIPCSAKFVALGSKPNGTGIIQIYEICQGEAKHVTEFIRKAAFKCGTFGASSLRSRNFATGDYDGKLQVWNLEQPDFPVYSASAHKSIINCIDGIGGTEVGCGAPEIVTGSRDGSVKVWDIRQKDKPVAQMQPKEGEQSRDCWAVAFGNSYNAEERVVAAGYDNGDVKMFDLRNMSVKWETNVKNGVCCLEFDRKDILMNKLVAATLEARIQIWDVRTQHVKRGFACLTEKTPHNATVWLCRHLPQNREIFITTGGGGSLCLWKYNYPEKRVTEDADKLPMGVVGNLSLLQNASLSTQPISTLDWSPDKLGLAVCTSFDQTIRVLITTKLNLY